MINKETIVFSIGEALKDIVPPIIDMEKVIIRQLGARAFDRTQAPLLVPIREQTPVSPRLKRQVRV